MKWFHKLQLQLLGKHYLYVLFKPEMSSGQWSSCGHSEASERIKKDQHQNIQSKSYKSLKASQIEKLWTRVYGILHLCQSVILASCSCDLDNKLHFQIMAYTVKRSARRCCFYIQYVGTTSFKSMR